MTPGYQFATFEEDKGGSTVLVQTNTPDPATYPEGTLWYNPDDGRLAIDVNSNWIQIN